MLNPSVNAYRRLDPHFEAPNQIKASPNNRGAMVRIPTGNERTARIEVRSVAPDCNPYLAFYSIVRTALDASGSEASADESKRAEPGSSPTTSTTPFACSRARSG